MVIELAAGQTITQDELSGRLVNLQYDRNDFDFHRGTFRVRGDVVEVFPAHEEDRAVRIEFFGDEVERIVEVDPLTGEVLADRSEVEIYPAYEEFGYRVELFGDEVEAIATIDPLTGATLGEEESVTIYPAKHFVMPEERITGAIERIEAEGNVRFVQVFQRESETGLGGVVLDALAAVTFFNASQVKIQGLVIS
jgi:excinuclease UvrABC helicase subunit UvrB